MTTTIRKEWGKYPAITAMAKLAGVDMDAPMLVYTEQNLCDGEDADHVDYPPPLMDIGLVSYQCEEADELWLDTKLVWTSFSARFYVSVYLVHDGAVHHYTMDNNCDNLAAYNSSVSHDCKTCIAGTHGTELAPTLEHFKFCNVDKVT